MKIKNLQSGFAPLLIIAIVAVIAVGGGVYVSKQKEVRKAELRDNPDTQANANADANANANANLGVNANAKGSLRSLLALGKDQMCTFAGNGEDGSYSGTVYISTKGEMRGDFETKSYDGITNSHMIISGGTYVWSGTEGIKTKLNNSMTGSVNPDSEQSKTLDSQVDYKCSDWTIDRSKFAVPADVKFTDFSTMMNLQGGVKIP